MYEELKLQDVIDMMNRQVKQMAARLERETSAEMRIKIEAKKQELHWLLGRITAHKHGIRHITND